MTKAEKIRQAAAEIRRIKAEKEEELKESTDDFEASKLALQLASTDAIVEAIQSSKMSIDEIATVFAEAVSKIKVESPKIDVPKADVPKAEVTVTVPEIKLPTINVPKPEVTVNVPEIKIPKIDVPQVNFTLPDRINVGLQDISPSKPLAVISVDPKGNYIQGSAVGGGGRSGITKQQMEEVVKPNMVVPSLSPSSPLSAGETFTGEWVDVEGYQSIVVATATDQDGTYSIQFSPDGVNQDSTLTRYHKTDEINVPHRFTITRKYARVVFENTSASPQTYFRMQTMVGDLQPLNVPIDGTIAPDYDATVVRTTDYRHEVDLGLRQGRRHWTKFGYNEDVDTGAGGEVISFWGEGYTPLTTPTVIDIVSNSATDTFGGAGAQSVRVFGIDSTRSYQVADYLMNGTTTVSSGTQWLGINRAVVTSSGASTFNTGIIGFTASGTNTSLAVIPEFESVTQQLIFHTQADHKAEIDSLHLTAQPISGGNPVVTFRAIVYSPTTNTNYEILREILDTGVGTSINPISKDGPLQLNSGDVIKITAETTANNTRVAGRFSLIEYKDVDA